MFLSKKKISDFSIRSYPGSRLDSREAKKGAGKRKEREGKKIERKAEAVVGEVTILAPIILHKTPTL